MCSGSTVSNLEVERLCVYSFSTLIASLSFRSENADRGILSTSSNNSRYLVNSIDESSNVDSPQLESTFTVYKVGTFTIFCVVEFRKILQGFKTL